MADAIVRLRVESSEYDQKLSRATQQLQHMEKEVRRTGATFAYADKEELAFIQSLGSMETKTTSAKSQLREYTEALMQMTATYRNLSQEEKSSPFGQAIAASIDKLKAKAAELQDIMSDTQREIQNLASDTSFTQGLSMMTRTIGASASAIVAWTGDSKEMEAVIKDLAKIGTTVAAVDSLTKAFQKQNLVLLKNPYVAAAAAVVALGVAIGELIKKNSELSESEKQVSEATKSANDKIGSSVGSIMGKYNRLKSEWESLTTAQEKRDWLDNNKTAFEQLGLSINNVVDADNAFVTSTDKVVAALKARAKANALQGLYEEKVKEVYENAAKTEDKMGRRKAGDTVGYSTAEWKAFEKSGISQEGMFKTKSEMNAYSGDIQTFTTFTEEGAKVFNQFLDNLHKEGIEEATKIGMETVEELYGSMYATSLNEANAAEAATNGLVNGQKKKPVTVETKTEEKAPEGSIKAMREQLSGLQKDWELATDDDSRKVLKDQIDEVSAALDKMIGKTKEVKEVSKEGPLMNFSEKGLANLGSQIKGKMSSAEIGSEDYKMAAENMLDFTTFENLLKAATERGVQIDPEWLSSIFDDIKIGADVAPETWQALVDTINTKLADLGLEPIKLDVDTGGVTQLQKKLEELPTQFEMVREQLDKLSSGVGAISTIGNAFNELKGIGEDLASAFSGEMDAWDSLMTVFNSGISIMQTVIGVIEAINTLTELSNTLSDVKVAKQAAETTAVVTGKGSEMAATAAEASVSAAELGVDTADAAAKAGKAVAWIPIVGPILAAAAIAAIVAAIMGAQSQAKSAGKFATGGLIPGSSFSGDNLTANVNSGELILNRAQQGAIAGQLQSNPMGNMQLETRISGTDMLIFLNNTNRSLGGSRSFYSERH